MGLGIVACSEQDSAPDNSLLADTGIPTHNYKMKEGINYGYVGGISDEERASGKAAAELHLFRYLGKQDGLDTIEQVDENGNSILKAQCANPCEFMKLIVEGETQRVQYNPETLGGAVMQDAQRGFLEVAAKTK